MNRRLSPRVVFITGSDTGVGKTVLTALLTVHLRRARVPVFALKPFCSGGREDAELLFALQNCELTLDEINPFHFAEPLAPFVAARKSHRSIVPSGVLRHIHAIAEKFVAASRPTLLIEGVGGLLVPLAKRFSVLDLIERLDSHVLVVAPNKLGTINHCLLSLEALSRRRIGKVTLVLMDTSVPDASSASNPRVLSELVSPIPVIRFPFLRPAPMTAERIKRHASNLRRHLDRILA